MESLPDLPPSIRTLTNAEADRIGFTGTPKDCLTCGGRERFTDPRGVEVQCNCEDQWVLHRYLLHCGIGTAYQRLGWSDTGGVSKEPLVAVHEWMENSDQAIRSGTGLLMTGPKGSGKTMVAALLAKGLLAKGHNAFFIPFSALITALMDAWFERDRTVHDRCRSADVLVIDDLGQEKQQVSVREGGGTSKVSTETSEYAIESMLRHRVASSAPTVITTNLSEQKLAEAYGGHFASLLTEAAEVHHFAGADWRGKARARNHSEGDAGRVRPLVLG